MVSILIHTVDFDEVCCSVIGKIGFLFSLRVQNKIGSALLQIVHFD